MLSFTPSNVTSANHSNIGSSTSSSTPSQDDTSTFPLGLASSHTLQQQQQPTFLSRHSSSSSTDTLITIQDPHINNTNTNTLIHESIPKHQTTTQTTTTMTTPPSTNSNNKHLYTSNIFNSPRKLYTYPPQQPGSIPTSANVGGKILEEGLRVLSKPNLMAYVQSSQFQEVEEITGMGDAILHDEKKPNEMKAVAGKAKKSSWGTWLGGLVS
jgi:hypothetical protein